MTTRGRTEDSPTTGDARTLRFERRRSGRTPVTGKAVAQRVGGERFGQEHRLLLRDCSCGGLGAACDTVIEPGTIIWVAFEWPPAAGRRAMVRRCEPCGDGYRIAIQYEQRLAA